MQKWDLGFGNSPVVRQAFLDTYNKNLIIFGKEELSEFNYPDRASGDEDLVKTTKEVLKRQIGKEYKHVFLTNGATGGVVISLRAYKLRNKEICLTRSAPWYVRYPSMIMASGLKHQDYMYSDQINKSVILLDLPSNPLASMDPIDFGFDLPIILDGVYYNNVYTKGNLKSLPHDVFVGSYSKLLGLNGIRLGFIATNDDLLADDIGMLITAEYCGLSVASTDILNQSLKDLDWPKFENKAKSNLDRNREEWSKLSKFFGNSVPEIGMFHYGPLDRQFKSLLEKSNVIWTKGETMGTNGNYGRFNLGQDFDILRNAVKEILKNDKI